MSFADNTFFAPESLLTPDGRRVMWAWLFDARSQEVVQKSGWSGMMSLPRELFMRKDHTLGMRPVSELRSLRYNEKSYAAQNISKVTPLVGATGDVKEIVVEIDPREATKCGVRILESQDGKEYGEIYYDVSGKKLVLDMSRLNAIGMAPVTPLGVEFKKVEEAPFELQKGEKLVLDILIDKCIVEVYANERQALVRTNAFFSESNEKNISLFWRGILSQNRQRLRPSCWSAEGQDQDPCGRHLRHGHDQAHVGTTAWAPRPPHAALEPLYPA